MPKNLNLGQTNGSLITGTTSTKDYNADDLI